MKPRHRTLKRTILFAVAHCLVGNVVGVRSVRYAVPGILEYLFLPYTFIAGLSAFAGWAGLALFLELVSLFILILVFYPIALLLERKQG